MIEPLEIEVRFRDCDMLGHVNNAVYLSYFEQARMYYFEQILNDKWNYEKHGILLVKNVVEYLKPIQLEDRPKIYLFLNNIGNKSFTFYYEVIVNGDICTKGLSKLVCFDFQNKITTHVYPEFKEAFQKLEKKDYV